MLSNLDGNSRLLTTAARTSTADNQHAPTMTFAASGADAIARRSDVRFARDAR